MRPIDKMMDACRTLGLEDKVVANWHRVKHPCNPSGDTRRSFGFRETDDGTLLLSSHKPSYSTDDALKTLGLTWADMFTQDPRADGWMVHGYEYTDENGRPVGRVTRQADKNFPQGHYDHEGVYHNGLGGKELPLYYLPVVKLWAAEGREIWVCEGEKDARSLIGHDQPATTKPGGAKSEWKDCQVEPLAGLDIVIVADKDEAGYKAAVDAYVALLPVAKSLRIVEAKEGKDATDHLEAGHGTGSFVDRSDLVPQIPIVSASGKVVRCVDIADVEDARAPDGVPTGFSYIDRLTESKGLPKGQMTVWAARKKVGKTSGMCQVARHACKEGYRVLYLTFADLQPPQVFRRLRRQETGWADSPDDLLKASEWQRNVDNMRSFWDLKLADAQMVGGRDVANVVPGIEALHAKHGFDLVIVDYAQKLVCSKERDRVRAMETVSSDLSFMADRRGFALLVGSQLNEDGQTRYSQEFEDDCGLMLSVSAPEGLDALRREFDCPYNRFGPSFSFKAFWNKSRLTFEEEKS